jgi:hypothetical protein
MSFPCPATQAMAVCATLTLMPSATLAQGLHQPEVGVDVGSLKAWAVRPEITGSGGILLPVVADEAPREHAIGSFERGRLAR